MHDVAWRGMWICVRSKDAQKQLARTSVMFITAVCLLFLLKLKWQNNESVYDRAKKLFWPAEVFWASEISMS